MKTIRTGNQLQLGMNHQEWTTPGQQADGRLWAVFIGAELLAIVEYRKGADENRSRH
ncbi:MAG: hypothetical protein WCN95_14755 [bacterium]